MAIGGGNGLSNLLKGFVGKNYDITAVSSVMDSGGSTGRLKREFGTLAYGDIRRALAAISQNKPLSEIFNYRFTKGKGLAGHVFGNLFLLALKQCSGSEKQALKIAQELLKVRGQVLPVTYDRVELWAKLENGQVIHGEDNIDVPKHDGKLKIKKLYLNKPAKINPDVQKSILAADIIVIGPGDLYTSLLANIIVEGVSSAIKKSRAKKIWVINLTNKYGETVGFSLNDYLDEIDKYLGVNIIDHVFYQQKPLGTDPIKIDLEKIRNTQILIGADFVKKEKGPLIHDRDIIINKILEI